MRRRYYVIEWDNGHSCGVLPEEFLNRRKAEQYARSWKREMVEADEDRKAAREAYQWEVVTKECE